jgi:hypothetical protein
MYGLVYKQNNFYHTRPPMALAESPHMHLIAELDDAGAVQTSVPSAITGTLPPSPPTTSLLLSLISTL